MAKKDEKQWIVFFDEDGRAVQWGPINSQAIQKTMDTCAYAHWDFETEEAAGKFRGNASRC
ncbi:MAG: hypothetical protein ACD_15C00104G0015 [uncultured bacterium]|nr:MAG: hypothetical protein ACD_15C00104G0015 [uncultured bacterium]